MTFPLGVTSGETNRVATFHDFVNSTNSPAACCSERVVKNAETISDIAFNCSIVTLAVVGAPVSVPILAGGVAAVATLICFGPAAIPIGIAVGYFTGQEVSLPLADYFWWNEQAQVRGPLYVAGALFAASMALSNIPACCNATKRDYIKIRDHG